MSVPGGPEVKPGTSVGPAAAPGAFQGPGGHRSSRSPV